MVGTISACQDRIAPELYYEQCIEAMCSCTSPAQECLCPFLSHYSRLCSNKGSVADWTLQVPQCGENGVSEQGLYQATSRSAASYEYRKRIRLPNLDFLKEWKHYAVHVSFPIKSYRVSQWNEISALFDCLSRDLLPSIVLWSELLRTLCRRLRLPEGTELDERRSLCTIRRLSVLLRRQGVSG